MDAPDPMCLFYYPYPDASESYIPSTKEKPFKKTLNPTILKRKFSLSQKQPSSSSDLNEDMRKHKSEGKGVAHFKGGKYRIRRRLRQPSRHLASRLLTSVQDHQHRKIPPLTKVLHTLTDAWSNPKQSADESEKEHKVTKPSRNIFERRRSVPEEIIRKCTVTQPKTSESEAHATMPEFTSPSSKENEKPTLQKSEKLKSTAFSEKVDDKYYWPPTSTNDSFKVVQSDDRDKVHSGENGSSDSDSDALCRFNTIKRAPLRRGSVVDSSQEIQSKIMTDRAMQIEYQRRGEGVLSIKKAEKSSQTRHPGPSNDSEETASPRGEESESAVTSDTISSPRPCTKPLSSSENLSSESECIRCTCTEIESSKETSTDPNHSGKSTLSQTVSDKTLSTQDTTVSVNSVSSRGSTITADTDSSSTEADTRTSAKETTTSPDHTPRPPPRYRPPENDKDGPGRNFNNKNGNFNNYPQYNQGSRNKESSQQGSQIRKGNVSQHRRHIPAPHETEFSLTKQCTSMPESPPYKWTQLSKEELWLIQDQRQKRFLDNERRFGSPMTHHSEIPQENLSVGTNATNVHSIMESNVGLPHMVPRYSALPRTMSMVVNSSFESHPYFSDSDCPSLADSLEDGNDRDTAYFDTKQEQKPVRGDVENSLNNTKRLYKEPRGRAYFFSISDSGDAELVTNIHKIPEIPEEIKKKLEERHLSMCGNRSKPEEPPPKLKKGLMAVSDPKSRHKLIKRKPKAIIPTVNTPSTGRTPPTTRASDISINPKSESKLFSVRNVKKSNQHPLPDSKVTKVSKYGPRVAKDKIPLRANDKTKTKLSVPQENVSLETKQIKPLPINEPERHIEKSVKTKTNTIATETLDFQTLEKEGQSLIASLEATAAAVKSQAPPIQWNRPQQVPKPLAKFHQRFEVIPEERSSSLTSSADEHLSGKDRRRSLPVKLTDTATSPTFLTAREGKSFRRYSLGSLSSYVIAKLMGKPLQAIPCVRRGPNNENQQIVIFSPKDTTGANSSKGRDALLAMNREDFNRLSKGWMNFYLLKESSNSEDDEEEDEISAVSPKATNNALDQPMKKSTNTIVCRIPTMKKDPQTTSETASGTGTDECSTSPSVHPSKRRFSLQLKDPETNSFQLEEYNPQEANPKASDFLDHITEESEFSAKDTFYSENKPCERVETTAHFNEPGDQNPNKQPRENTKVPSSPSRLPHLPIGVQAASTNTGKYLESNELTEPIKLSCSNTILQSVKRGSPPPKAISLPELSHEKPARRSPKKAQSLVEQLPQIPGASSDSQLTDSDSTGYLNIPSPNLPRLPIEDCDDCYSSASSSSDDLNVPAKTVREKSYLPLRRRPLPFRPKNRFSLNESKRSGKAAGWSVTVEGTLEFARNRPSRPDVQMRLSFPQQVTPPFVNQSDSGFTEEHGSKPKRSASQKPHWTVTVNPPHPGSEGRMEKQKKTNLGQQELNRISKRSFKEVQNNRKIKDRLSSLWPKIQDVLENELGELTLDCANGEMETFEEESMPLSVEGRAVPMESKPRATKMTNRTSRNSMRSTN